MSDVFENIRIIAASGAAGIYHHGTQTDNLWLDNKIDKVCDYLKCMRDTGVQVGLGTHIPEVVEYAEEKNWDIDFYMCCFYNISRSKRESAIVSKFSADDNEIFSPEDPARMCGAIKAVEKMCLAFKILGAARCCGSQNEVKKAFEFAYSNIKPGDAVVVGMFPKYEDQIKLNAGYAMDCCN
jgi:hypothetical protein